MSWTQDLRVQPMCYKGYYWTPKMAKNWPKQHNEIFFCPKGKKAEALRRS